MTSKSGKAKMSKQVSEAKFKSAIDALRQLLMAASDAAHECEADKTEDDRDIDRTYELGWLTKFAADLCGPRARVLTNVALLLVELQDDDEPSAHPSDTPH
jgi:hypothetical protein